MKAKTLLLTSIYLLLSALSSNGQEFDTLSLPSSYAFDKGKLGFDIMRNFRYRTYTNSYNDIESGKHNDLNIDVNVNYFIARGIGIGLDLHTDWSGDNYVNNDDEKYRNIIAYLNFTYGRPINNNANIYGRIGVGYGTKKYIEETSNGNTNTDKYDLFGLKFTVGAPLRIGGGNTYFTPQLTYSRTNRNFDGGKETDSRFNVGFNLEGYLNNDEMTCNRRQREIYSAGRYEPGNNFIGYYSKAGYTIGGYTTEYDNFPDEYEDDYSKAKFMLDYNRYVVKNVAIGAEIGYRRQMEKPNNSSWEYTNSSLMFMPKITVNTPVDGCWNNTFLQGGYGFGYRKSVTEGPSSSNTYKDNTTSISTAIGYNHFFADKISFTPIAGYEWNTRKDSESTTDDAFKTRGFFIEMGVRVFY